MNKFKKLFYILFLTFFTLTLYAENSNSISTEIKITVTEDANIRYLPTTEGVVIKVAKKGEVYTGHISEDNSNWYKIKVDNKDGYIHSSVVKESTNNSSSSSASPLIPIILIILIIYIVRKNKNKSNSDISVWDKLKSRSLKLADSDPLPIISNSPILLKNGEVCHYCGKVQQVRTKNVVVGHTGRSGGISTRIMKGVYLRTGSSASQAIREDVQETANGTLSVTSKRIIFSGDKWSFDKPILSLSSITPYTDALCFQFGDTQYTVLLAPAEYVYKIIARIINSSGGSNP